jgi:hypothetical protein
MEFLSAGGAYGREATLEDWQSGKDFRDIDTGQYFSNRDTELLKKSMFTGIQFFDYKGKFIFKVVL